jgi:uncharacterized protein (DUF4415 family)
MSDHFGKPPHIADEPGATVMSPAQFRPWKRGPGRPPLAAPKVHVGFRLAAEVVAAIKATGRGYNARVEKVLREALAEGKL